jgi:RNA polymerase sigma factor (sigma-70 family)
VPVVEGRFIEEDDRMSGRLSCEDMAEIVDAHADALLLFARQWSHAAAEDVVQEAFLQLVRRVRANNPPENVVAWLHRVIRNELITRHHGRRRSRAREERVASERPGWFEPSVDTRLDARCCWRTARRSLPWSGRCSMNPIRNPTMAADKRNPDPSEEDVPTPIDPNEAAEAVKEVQEALAILPKKRFGCLGRFVKYAAVLLALLAAFVYWNFLRTPPLKISKETTYITEPLTSDGTRVDYFAALEKLLYSPEMKTENNGYRLIVRALGDVTEDGLEEARSAQVYAKLGLDPEIEPTLTYIETYRFLREYCAAKGLDEKQANALDEKVFLPWTLDDLPMMELWLEESGPVLDFVGEAVRKSVFCFPLVRPRNVVTLAEAPLLGEIQRMRSFTRMLQARADYRIGTGDIDGAIDDLGTCERLGRHMQRQGTVITRLVGIAIESIAASVGIAAIRESQPSKEQLQRLVDEHNSLPPLPNMDRMWLAERYYMLDSLQAIAVGKKSLAELFSVWAGNDEFRPGFAAISVDWNIVMRRVNADYDDPGKTHVFPPPSLLSLSNLFIGARSRHVADCVAGLYTPAFQVPRRAIRRLKCVDNLRRITLAMLIYARAHGTLPPAYTVDADGNPLQSWRVLLLPYLGAQELYGKLHLDEPWDSAHNRRFHDQAPAIYQCPSAKLAPGQTTYSVVVGEKTAFQTAQGKSLDDLGMILMLVVEREQSACWMDPMSELVEAIACKGINRHKEGVIGIGSPHPGCVNVGFRDGSAQSISVTTALPLLQGLLDGTAVSCPD